MKELNQLLDEYDANVKIIMAEKYGSNTFKSAEAKIINTLKTIRGHITDNDLARLTQILDEYGGQEILIELAYTLSDLGTEKSFDYLLRMFNECFEDGCEEYNTATACFEGMESIDKERTKKEGIYDHIMFTM